MSTAIEFPPLLTGVAVPGDPWDAAMDSACNDGDPGTVFYGVDEATMRVALLLAPEQALERAIGVSFAVTLGFNDALGALAPPEVALHLEWPDRLRVNGANCGKLCAMASTTDPKAEPDWLVLGLNVPVVSTDDTPGTTPDETSLHAEGCGDILVPDLIEAWGSHTMNWLHVYLTEGFEPLHREWLTKAHGRDDGTFLGLDELGGLLEKHDEGTRIRPLTEMQEQR